MASEMTPLKPSSTVSIGRAAGKRVEVSDNPLLGSPDESSTGSYAVYSGPRKRNSGAGPPTEDPSVPAPPAAAPSYTPPVSNASATTSISASRHVPPLPRVPPAPRIGFNSPPDNHRKSSSSTSEAKDLLAAQSLKAETQKIGLPNDSVGAAMVMKLVGLGKEQEWVGVVKALVGGKGVLLLPMEKLTVPEQLTPELFMDHLLLVDGPTPSSSSKTRSSKANEISTYSGIRGTLESNALILSRVGNPVSLPSDGRVSQISPSTSTSPVLTSPYPTYQLRSPISQLSVHRAPPYLATQSDSNRPGSSTGSRLAALFAKPPPSEEMIDFKPSSEPRSDDDDEEDTPDPAPTSSSPVPPLQNPAFTKPSLPNFELTVRVVDKTIRKWDVDRGARKAFESHFRNGLMMIDGCELGLIDIVMTFINRLSPPPVAGSRLIPANSLSGKGIDEVSEAFQEFYQLARYHLIQNIHSKSKRERKLVGGDPAAEVDQNLLEERADASLGQIEDLLTVTLDDQLFSAPSSGDTQRDENLSSRIAALNILELSLDHLGLDLGEQAGLDGWDEERQNVRDSIEDIILLAGKELSQLQESSIRTPRDKLAVFVNLHKILVENLSRLPPIPLKEVKSDRPSSHVDVEMDDASFKSSTSSASEPPLNDDDEELLRTPRPPTSSSSTPVPEITLPSSSRSTSPDTQELASSVHEATSSSLFDPSPPPTLRRVATPPPAPPLPSSSTLDSASSSRSSSIHKPTTTSSSADLILPLLIYLVVRSNPPQFISHLLFVQRFHAEALLRGESSYCATNFSAVVEFLNEVDIASLGLDSTQIVGAGRGTLSRSTQDDSSSTYERRTSSSTTLPTYSTLGSLATLSGRQRVVIKARVSDVTPLDKLVDGANSALVNALENSVKLFFPKGIPKLEDVREMLDGEGSTSLIAGTGIGGKKRMQGGYGAVSDRAGSLSERAVTNSVPQPTDEATALSVSIAAKTVADIRPIVPPASTFGNRLAGIPGLGRLASSIGAGGASGTSTPTEPTPSLLAKPASLFSSFNPTSRRRGTSISTVPSASNTATSSTTVIESASTSTSSTASNEPFVPNLKFMQCQVGELKISEIEQLLEEYRKLALRVQGQQGG